MKNKKAVIGDAMVWVVATLIIVFILLFYLIGVGSEGLKKAVGTLFGKSSVEELKTNLVLNQELISFLNTRVEDEKTMRDLINELVSLYLDEDNKIVSIRGVDNINNLYIIAPELQTNERIKVKFDDLKFPIKEDKEKKEKLKEIMRDECRDYILKIPIGYIYNLYDSEGFDYSYGQSIEPFKWSNTTSVFNYNGYQIKIEYWRNLKC